MKFKFTEDQPVETDKEACPYCGEMFKSVARHLPYCDRNPNKNTDKHTKKPDKDAKKDKVKLLMKYFDYARSGHKYYKKLGFSNYSDFKSDFYMKLLELSDLV